jgi:hypothetical protein
MIFSSRFSKYVVIPAVLVCLGWGLRGYIGGGPLGAMIPGAYLALWIALLLGLDLRRASLVAVFSATGIGIGGEMTYGQTLGLLHKSDTLLWGLLGTVVKGGVWGLLGGALLGFGFLAHRLSLRTVGIALLILCVATVAGIALINQPRLIYFSDPINKPRDEIWAGLLFGAVALLAYLRFINEHIVPLRFALWGMLGGAVGFGVGGVLMAIGWRLPQPYKGLPWWKFMEFTFGACLGASLGWAAQIQQDALREGNAAQEPAGAGWKALGASVLLVVLGLVVWNYTAEGLIAAIKSTEMSALLMPLSMVLLGYTALACVFILLGMRSETMAWQAAITVTLIASVVDLQDGFVEDPGLQVGAVLRWGMVWAALIASVLLVLAWQRGSSRSFKLPLLGLLWADVAIAYIKLLCTSKVFGADLDGSVIGRMAHELGNHAIVHGIFTATAIIGTVAILRYREDSHAEMEHT